MTILHGNGNISSVNHRLQLPRKYVSAPFGLVALICVSLVIGYSYTQYFRGDDLTLHSSKHHNFEKPPLALMDVRHLVQRLLVVHRHLEQSFRASRPPALKDLRELELVAAEMYPPLRKDVTASTDTPLVCPEHYYGPKSEVGWATVNCTTAKPVDELVTVVLNAQASTGSDVKKHFLQLIRDFSVSYPRIKMVVVGSGLTVEELPDHEKFVTLLPPVGSSSGRPGKAWNTAIKRVKTPFVLLARDVYRFSSTSSSLERVLRILTEVPGVGAVGGAVRNISGYWHVGCFQSRLKNYVLEYQKGYHFSRNESMFCDYVDGPFVAYTHLMKSIILDQHLESEVLFQDFFLILSRTWLTMVCPDVMFYANGRMVGRRSVLHRHSWVNMARKFELNRVLVRYERSEVLHKFSCGDIGINCHKKIQYTSYYAIPVCCLEEFVRALAFWDSFCSEHHFRNYFDSGTALGAVKMSDVIPWDLDADGGYPEVNYTFIKQSAPLFAKHGFSLGAFEDPVCCDKMPNGMKRSYMKLYAAGMYVELWGDWWHPYDTFLYANKTVALDTRMNVHGVWINGPPNPGYYARKRYGSECLRHVQSWSQVGMKTSWEPYKAGRFLPCINRGHHACLDSFPADGNIAFLVPE